MHVFQPIPIELLELNPFTRIRKDKAVVVVEAEGKANAGIIQWGGFGYVWEKNVCVITLHETRYTKELLDKAETFSINFFDDSHMKSTVKYLSLVSGRDEDKLKGARLHLDKDSGTSYLDEAHFVLVCKTLSRTKLNKNNYVNKELVEQFAGEGYYTMYMAEIIDVLAR